MKATLAAAWLKSNKPKAASDFGFDCTNPTTKCLPPAGTTGKAGCCGTGTPKGAVVDPNTKKAPGQLDKVCGEKPATGSTSIV